jgi:ATP-dependent exoDNAse (exonuclease V) beta subunit
MQMIPDANERQSALDPTRSFIIQAPAGSGKTELLMQRYLTLLARVNQAPEEIIALTFTRKAALEMHDRIVQALQLASQQKTPETHHGMKTWQLAQAVLQRNQAEGWDLLSHPNRLRILTIDSLCASITRQMPVLSHFGAQPSTIETPELIYLEASRTLLSTINDETPWANELATLITHVDNDQAKLENLLVQMLAKREQWLAYLAEATNPALLRQHLEASLQKSIIEHLTNLNELFNCGFNDELKAELLELIRFAACHVPPSLTLARAKDLIALPEVAMTAKQTWQNIAELLLTQDGKWRKDINKNQGFPTADKTTAKADKLIWKTMKQRMRVFLAACVERDKQGELQQALASVQCLPTPYYSEQQWHILQALFQILPALLAHLQLRFQAHGQVDFTEIALRARQALGSPSAPTDLALALDYRIQHLLIDEFQDTSTNQFQLLEQLTAGWQPGDGRTLFIVGDPMQSIYRFRKAEVSLFLRLWEHGLNHITLEPIRLQTNFRSDAAIINWINDCFSKILPAQADLHSGAVPHSPAFTPTVTKQETLQQTAVYSHVLNNSQAEAKAIIELIHQHQQHGSIAILVRAKNHLTEILPALQQAGIAYHAVELEVLKQRPIIQDLLALTKALVHPADRIAWLSILRAPWCGLSLADLHALAGENHAITLLESMNNLHLLALSHDGRNRLERFQRVIASALQQYQRIPLALWVENTWLALGGPACVTQPKDLDDAQAFFNLLASLQQGGWIIDTSLLENRLNQLFATSTTKAINNQPAVQVMTIHKAKGLEFDTVILPSLQRTTNQDSEQLLLWQERINSDESVDLVLGTLKAHSEDQDVIYNYLRTQENIKQQHELARLLYVATTRAKRHLHLLAVIDKENFNPSSNSLLAKLWTQVQQNFSWNTSITETSTSEAANAHLPMIKLKRLASDWQSPLTNYIITTGETPAITLDINDNNLETNCWQHTGTLIHRMLYRISQDGHRLWHPKRLDQCTSLWQHQLLSLGVAPSQIPTCLQRINQALQQTLNDPRGQWLLDKTHQDAQAEYRLTAWLNGIYQEICIDRTFIDSNGIRWIVDYKTSNLAPKSDLAAFLKREQARYSAQLERYAALMRLKENHPIRLGLYFPLLSAWQEWEFGT